MGSIHQSPVVGDEAGVIDQQGAYESGHNSAVGPGSVTVGNGGIAYDEGAADEGAADEGAANEGAADVTIPMGTPAEPPALAPSVSSPSIDAYDEAFADLEREIDEEENKEYGFFDDDDFDDYSDYQYARSVLIPSTRSAARAAAASAASPYSGISDDPMAIFVDDNALDEDVSEAIDEVYELISTSFANAESEQERAKLIQDVIKRVPSFNRRMLASDLGISVDDVNTYLAMDTEKTQSEQQTDDNQVPMDAYHESSQEGNEAARPRMDDQVPINAYREASQDSDNETHPRMEYEQVYDYTKMGSNLFNSSIPDNWVDMTEEDKSAYIHSERNRATSRADYAARQAREQADEAGSTPPEYDGNWRSPTPAEARIEEIENYETVAGRRPSSKELIEKDNLINDKSDKNTRRIARMYHVGWISFHNQEVIDTNVGRYVRMPNDVMRAYNDLAGVLGLEIRLSGDPDYVIQNIRLMNQFVMNIMGYCTDRDGKIFDKPATDPSYKDLIETASVLAQASIEHYGHPFGFTQTNIDYHRGFSSPRIPCGAITREQAQALIDADIFPYGHEDCTVDEYIDIVAQQYVESTANAVEEACILEGNDQRKIIMEDQIRAMCTMNGRDSYDTYGVPRFACEPGLIDMLILSQLNQDWHNGNPDIVAVNNDLEQKAKLALTQRNPRRQGLTNVNGEWMISTSSEIGKLAMKSLRFFKIIGNIPLAITSAIEHPVGILMESIADSAMYKLGKSKGWSDDRSYMPTRTTYRMLANSPDFISGFIAYRTLIQSGGIEMGIAFSETGELCTKENIAAFVAKTEPQWQHDKLEKFYKAIDNIPDLMQTADNLYQFVDAKQFVKDFMLQQSFVHGVDIKEFEHLFERNPQALLTDMLRTDIGRQSVIANGNLNANRMSPVTMAVQMALRRHGIADASIALLMDNAFIQYTIKAGELLVPFSNTLSYATFINGGLGERGDGMIGQYQLGGFSNKDLRDQTHVIYKCLLYDSMVLGKRLTLTILIFLLSSFGKIEQPDDEEDEERKFNPWEFNFYLFGSDEGIRFKQSWFMDDLLQWSVPAAVSCCYLKDTGDISGATRIFWNGVNDIYGPQSIFDSIATLAMASYDVVSGNGSEKVQRKILDTLDYVLSPMGITQFTNMEHNGEFERDSRYARDKDGNEVYREGHTALGSETLVNEYACRNDLMALIFNAFFQNDSTHPFGWENSGYKYDPDKDSAEAAATWGTDVYLKASHEFLGEDSTVTDEELMELWCMRTYNILTSTDDPNSLFTDHGFLLPVDDAYIYKAWCYRQIDAAGDAFQEAQEAYARGKITSNQFWQYQALYKSTCSKYWDSLDALAYDGLIYDRKVYKVVVGDYVKNSENDKYYNYGNTPNSFAPFQVVDDGKIKFRNILSDKGFNTESYRNDGTAAFGRHDIPNEENPQVALFRSDIKDRKAEYNEASNNADKKTGNGALVTASAKNNALMPKSPSDSNKDDGIIDTSKIASDVVSMWNSQAKDLFGEAPDLSGGNGSGGSSGGESPIPGIWDWIGENPGKPGYGYRGYSKGSSSYSPKIYSYSGGNISSRPATMYSKTPYSRQVNYLNPGFSTKGSRTAYNRQEL